MERFVPFSAEHLTALLLIAVASVAVPLAVRRAHDRRLAARVALALAAATVVFQLASIGLGIWLYDRPLAQQLPLHLCGISMLLTAIMLARQSYSLFEILYFWGLAGGMQALLTPDLLVGFPHPLYISFFAGHGLIVLGVVYALLVFRFRPVVRSLTKTAWITLCYMVLMLPVNSALGTNFLYLLEKPAQPSLLDLLGPWPWYLFSMIAVGVVLCILCYLPFAVYDVASRRGCRIETRGGNR